MNGRPSVEVVGPAAILVLVGLVSLVFPDSLSGQFRFALVLSAMVVSIHTFTGNSGVISFGHISFVAVGAFAAGLTSLSAQQKQNVFPELFPIIRDNQFGNLASLALAAVLGAVFAGLVGLPLMRLHGLAAGIATFAVLGITRNVLRNWTKIGPGAKTLPGVPETTGVVQAVIGALVVVGVAWLYQRSPSGRRLRATREDPAASRSIGISTYRERLVAFTISGGLAGFAGGLYVHYLGSVTTEQVYLELTFVTLAMLVIGGLGSLWGAVLGGLVVTGLSSLLAEFEKGIDSLGGLRLPGGTRDIVLGVVMVAVLLARPKGLTSGREFSTDRLGRR